MFNRVILIGRLGHSPKLETSSKGTPYCNFTLATNTGFGNNKRTDWHSVTAFNKTAENVYKYLKKGSLALVEGSIQYGEYEKDGVKHKSVKILADNVRFIGGKEDGQTSEQASSSMEYQPPENHDTFEGDSFGGGFVENEEIPF